MRIERAHGDRAAGLRGLGLVLCLVLVLVWAAACGDDPERRAERLAVRSQEHPFAGFWKNRDCAKPFGWAITPAGEGLYHLTFCGPGGCFEPGSYGSGPTSIVGDTKYRVIDPDTLELEREGQLLRLVRCPGR